MLSPWPLTSARLSGARWQPCMYAVSMSMQCARLSLRAQGSGYGPGWGTGVGTGPGLLTPACRGAGRAHGTAGRPAGGNWPSPAPSSSPVGRKCLRTSVGHREAPVSPPEPHTAPRQRQILPCRACELMPIFRV
uniref:Uncharacterized protein n=1 Tax=Amazona collaria TaxID=241587 RepID=A0A8B9IXJ2_9PSIT